MRTFNTTLLLLAICATALAQDQNIDGVCLTDSLKKLVSLGCNFNASPEAIATLKKYGTPDQSFDFGAATYAEAAALWPTPAFLAGYFKTAIAQPMTPIRGETAAGIRYFSDFAQVSMNNIHLCSDQGEYADYLMTKAQLNIKTVYIKNFSKDDVRLAGW